ncbi:hypothetical protein KUV51_14360 [Tateyamaria omphalii]|uniref:hypothetical protein n=1 Tax=Tateyamaria omphalii TaxID=299262 RepID=UPI001C99F5B5|nr:hypothetical protein [Tateyamaria omphalii]MBY5934188.1 hypothetical protein [Tateyamaria omphalii]
MQLGAKTFLVLAFGPLLAVVAMIAGIGLVRWSAGCETIESALECGKLFGIWNINPDTLSYVGAGYAAAFSALWATGGLAIVLVAGIVYLISEFGRSVS